MKHLPMQRGVSLLLSATVVTDNDGTQYICMRPLQPFSHLLTQTLLIFHDMAAHALKDVSDQCHTLIESL